MKTEVKQPLFKVGDRPKWTPELIKQLPHGTIIECAFEKDLSTYSGEEVDYGIGCYLIGDKRAISYCHYSGCYAKIISLPDIKEASPEAQQEFVKANPGIQHVEEPKAGDMVEYCPNRIVWETGIYIAKWKEKFIVENKFGDVSEVYEIRLPQKSEVESKAKEILINHGFSADVFSNVNLALDLIKWGQANPGKI